MNLITILLPLLVMNAAQADSLKCAAGEVKTTVKVQMIRLDGTIQTPEGNILSKDYGDILETNRDNILETTFFCGEFSKPSLRMMLDALAAKYDLGARKGDIYVNKENVFARQSYVEGLLTLNVSNIATINRLVKEEPSK